MATWDAAMERDVRRRPIKAFRCEEAEAQVERCKAGLALFLSTPQDIGRALRAARRDGRMGASHYDPARHAALIRLWKAVGHTLGRAAPADGGARPKANGPATSACGGVIVGRLGSGGERGTGKRAVPSSSWKAQRPSNRAVDR